MTIEVEESGDILNRSRSEIVQVEYAEFPGAKCLTISTPLDCSRNYVRGECLCHLLWSRFSNKISPFLSFMCTDAFMDVLIQSWQFRRGGVSFADVISAGHDVQYLYWYRLLVESVPSSRDMLRCCFEKNCTRDLLISLPVCWKGTLAQDGLHLLSVSVPVGLLWVDIGLT